MNDKEINEGKEYCRFIVSSKVKSHPFLNTNFPCEKQAN